MKNKLLKSTLLITLSASAAVAIASSVAIATSQIKTNNDVATSTKASTQLNAVTKYTVTFDVGTTGATIEGTTTVKAKKGTLFGTIAQPIAYKDKRPQSYWVDSNGKKIPDSTPINENMTVYPYFEADIKLANCLSVIALEHTKFNITHYGTNQTTTKPNILYSTDGFKWQEFDGTTVDILPGSALYMRGKNPNGFNHDLYNYSQFTIAGTVHLNGSAMALIDDGANTKRIIPNDYCFARLFENCSGVKVISSDFIPASTLKAHCYESMFKNCTTLESFPNYLLEKATTLAERCYADMFTNCVKLTTISPDLLTHATTLAKECYFQMFRGCTGLTSLANGTLPPSTVALTEGCYTGMFRECTGLTTIGNNLLPATTLTKNCYFGMFESCTGLKDDAIQNLNLPAGVKVSGTAVGSLAEGCYKAMFYNCIYIEKVPTLGAETLKPYCYQSMFYNCLALLSTESERIELPATTMVEGCYSYMFYNCKSLEVAPLLPAANLAKGCYEAMFYNCVEMTTGPSSLPGTTYYESCYQEMFYNCQKMSTAPTMPTTGTVTLAKSCCQFMFAYSGITASPALIATAAAEQCYLNMFDSCTKLQSLGKVSLISLANRACYMMFVRCTTMEITTGSSTGAFFTCPSTTGLTEPVRCMFQQTYNVDYGMGGTSGYSYHYTYHAS